MALAPTGHRVLPWLLAAVLLCTSCGQAAGQAANLTAVITSCAAPAYDGTGWYIACGVNVTSDAAVDLVLVEIHNTTGGVGTLADCNGVSTNFTASDTVTCQVNYTFASVDLPAGTTTITLEAGASATDSVNTLTSTATSANTTVPLGIVEVGAVQTAYSAASPAKVGDSVTVTVALTNQGPVNVSAVTLTSSGGSVATTACQSAMTVPASSGAPPGTSVPCTATYTITATDVSTSNTKSLTFTAGVSTPATIYASKANPTGSVSIPVTPMTTALSGCSAPQPPSVAGGPWSMQCNVTITNAASGAGGKALTGVDVKFAREASFSSAANAVCTPAVTNASLAIGGTVVCSASVNLTAEDAAAGVVNLKAGAVSSTVHAVPATVTRKLGILQATATEGARDGSKIAIKVNVTNGGPGPVTQVVLALPNNVSFAASSPCSPNITSIASGSFQECNLEYSVATTTATNTAPNLASFAIWDVLPASPALTITASSLDLQNTLTISPLTLTLNKKANLTVRFTAGEVTAAGNNVTYMVELANRGNIALGPVTIDQNVVPSLSHNTTTLNDGLAVDEVHVMESVIPWNTTMVRTLNMSLLTNVTAGSTIGTVKVVTSTVIIPKRCNNNATVRPSNGVDCLNSTDCGNSADLRCDLTTLRPRTVCLDGAVEVLHDVGSCVYTPCKRCQLCLADFAAHIQTVNNDKDATLNDANVVASKLSTYCKARTGVNRTAASCDSASNAARNSFNGTAGKRAAVICRNLGECNPVNLPASCKLDTTGTSSSPAVPSGALDFCAPLGTNGTSMLVVPGVSAEIDFSVTKPPSGVEGVKDGARGTPCTQNWHCNTTGGEQHVCSTLLPGPEHVTCNATDGGIVVTKMGTCQPTPCQKCKECYTDMKTFTDAMRSLPKDAVALADDFKTVCHYDLLACSKVALQIESNTASFGAFAKRPVALCKALGLCNTTDIVSPPECVLVANTSATDISITAENADACTTDGKPYANGGALLADTAAVVYAADNETRPNVTALTPSRCFDDKDCGSAGVCSFADTQQWCQCQSINGSEACERMGTCILTDCDKCATCVAAVATFVKSQQQVTTGTEVANNFKAQAPQIAAGLKATFDSELVFKAIAASPAGNIGKKAGSLCMQMQFCVQTMATDTPCASINATITKGNITEFKVEKLDLCTVEGIPLKDASNVDTGANRVLGVNATLDDIPDNTCKVEGVLADKCKDGYKCDPTVQPAGVVCICDATSGADTCEKYATCVRTPCKVCSDCLATMSNFTRAHRFNTSDVAEVQSTFLDFCADSGLGKSQECADAVKDPRATLNGLKRAGLLCSLLLQCNATDVTGDCKLAPPPLVTKDAAGTETKLMVNTTGGLDLCKLDGTTASVDIPGTTSADTLPSAGEGASLTKSCERSTAETDCTGDLYCNLDAPRNFSRCTPSAGVDTAIQLGVCTRTPKVACETCLRTVQPWVDNTTELAAGKSPQAIGAGFGIFCKGGDRFFPAVCDRVQQAIAGSLNGNLARRAGSLCLALGECKPVNLTDTLLNATVTTSYVGRFSRCSKHGVDLAVDDALPDFPSALDTNGLCRVDGNCSTKGTFCDIDFTVTGRKCFCDEATGKDTCEQLGTCKKLPCTICQECLTAMQDKQNLSAINSYSSATVFDTECPKQLPLEAATCDTIKTMYFTDINTNTISPAIPNAFFALRAGAVCTAMTRCSNVSRDPKECSLNVTSVTSASRVIGVLDLCTAEGVLEGSQLPRVLTSGAKPGCLVDADCGNPELQCNTRNSTVYYNCSGGLDMHISYGKCIPKPVKPTGTPQQLCNACLDAFRPFVNMAVNSTATTPLDMGKAFYDNCSANNYELAACSRVQSAIESSFEGNLARRTGALCIRLGACSASATYTVTAASSTGSQVVVTPTPAPTGNTSNTTNTTAVSTTTTTSVAVPLTGAPNACTVEGVVGGALVKNTFSATGPTPNGTCVLDSDCGGLECSSASLERVCRCFDGLDSCEHLSKCQPKPAPPPADTRTSCQKCTDCIAVVTERVVRVATNDNSLSLASTFLTQCTSNLTANDVLLCKNIAASIAFSYNGNLAKRAGALCSRLGQCVGDAVTASKCNVTADKGLDLCTQQGHVHGTDIAVANGGFGENVTCVSDADCKGDHAGKVCDKATAKQRCKCNGGVDTCEIVGQCIDFCTSTKLERDSVNAAVPKCDSVLDNCGPGLVCKESPQCKQLQCDATGIYTAQCFGLCTPSERSMVGAKLENDGRTITIGLNTPAAAASFPCIQLFSTAIVAKLGDTALCTVAGTTLTVTMARDATIIPGDVFDTTSIPDSQEVLRDALSGKDYFKQTSSVTLTTCDSCQRPMVTVTGPKNVPEPCEGSTAADVVFDGFSRDGSGRPLKQLVWSQAGADVVLSAAIDKANSEGGARVVIPSSKIQSLKTGDDYTLTLSAMNYLGVDNSASVTFTKRASGAAPIVSVLGGLEQTFKVAQGISISTTLLAASVCAQTVDWEWKAHGWDKFAILYPTGYKRKDLVIPGPVPDMPSTEFKMELTAKFAGSLVATKYNVTLTPQASPVNAVLRGPAGDVRTDRTIVLNATSSVDPDDPTNNKEPFQIEWQCVRDDFPAPCFTGREYGTQRGLTWSIPGSLLTAERKYVFTATVKKSGDRSDKAGILITPQAGNIPTGRIMRVCGAACPEKHSADKDLSLSLVADTGFADATLEWSSDQVVDIASFNGKFDINIPAAKLPVSGSVTVTAKLTKGGLPGSTTITVPINGAPYCTADTGAGCLVVSKLSDTFPSAAWSALPANIADDDVAPLRYDFGTLDANNNRKVLAVDPPLPFVFSGLPVGDITLFMCAVDSYGARVCASQLVTLKTAPADFKVTDALTAIDVSQLAGANDVSVMAAGAQALQSLATFAGATAGTQTAEQQAQVQTAIAAKTSSMIGELAKDVTSLIDDPKTMSQVVSTVATLSKTTTSLSRDARSKMVAVGKAGLASAKLSPKPITPDSASRLLAVLAAGNGVSAACKLPTGCKSAASPTRIAGPAATRHLLSEAVSHQRRLHQDNATQSVVGQSAFSPAYYADATEVAVLLLQGTDPAAGWASSGDNGVYVAVANQPGRSYKGLETALAVGPVRVSDGSKSNPAEKDNVRVTFSENLLGSCTGENGEEITASDSCVVPTVVIYAIDPAGAVENAAALEDPADASVPDGFVAVSGVVTLKVGSADKGVLPCAVTGCTASLRVPVFEAASPSKLYQCFQVVDGQVRLSTAAVATTASRAIEQAVGMAPTFTCNVKQAGSYLVGRYPDPNYRAGVAESIYNNLTSLELGKPIYAEFKFEVAADFDYTDFFANKVEAFKTGVKEQMATTWGIPTSRITITNVYKGSILVDLNIDTSGLAQNQLQDIVGAITYNPQNVFTPEFLAAYKITGVTARITQAPTTGPNIPAIVGGVVGGVGGAAVIGGATWYILKKRRAAGVEPRTALLAEGQDV